MNENKYQELLVKTASYDPSTMLLYKLAGASQAITAAAKKGIIQRIIDGIVNQGTKLSQSVTGLQNAIKGRASVKSISGAGELGEAALKSYNKDIRRELANILKNKLTLGAAGATALNAGIAGGAGYMGYQKYKDSKAPKAEAAPSEPTAQA